MESKISTTYSNSNQEFVKVDMSITVSVEVSHQSLIKIRFRINDIDLQMRVWSDTYISFSLCNFDSILLQANKELLAVNLSVSVIWVEQSEWSSKSSDCSCTSGIELLSQSVQNYTKTITVKKQTENHLKSSTSIDTQDGDESTPVPEQKRIKCLPSTTLTLLPCMSTFLFWIKL